MSDPAVEAARRAKSGDHDSANDQRHAEDGAREGLAPIREAIETFDAYLNRTPTPYYDDRFAAALDAIEDIRKLAYSSEELADG